MVNFPLKCDAARTPEGKEQAAHLDARDLQTSPERPRSDIQEGFGSWARSLQDSSLRRRNGPNAECTLPVRW